MMPLTTVKPSPVPFPNSLVVKNGSKILLKTWGGIPWPVSATVSLTASLLGARARRNRPPSGWKSLTPTELQVAALVARGASTDEIARQMFVSAGTARTHLSHIYAKLGLTGRAELAATAARHGL